MGDFENSFVKIGLLFFLFYLEKYPQIKCSCHNSQNFLAKTGFIICRDESNQQIKTEFNSRFQNRSNFN